MDHSYTGNGYIYFAQEPMWVMEHKPIFQMVRVLDSHTYTRIRKRGKLSTFGWVKLEKPIGMAEAFYSSLVPAFSEGF